MARAFMYVFSWLLKGAQLKFILFSVIAMLFTLVMTFVVPNIAGFISPTALSAAFASVDPKVWYFINLMDLGSGTALIISAYVSRFIIRRLPFIG